MGFHLWPLALVSKRVNGGYSRTTFQTYSASIARTARDIGSKYRPSQMYMNLLSSLVTEEDRYDSLGSNDENTDELHKLITLNSLILMLDSSL